MVAWVAPRLAAGPLSNGRLRLRSRVVQPLLRMALQFGPPFQHGEPGSASAPPRAYGAVGAAVAPWVAIVWKSRTRGVPAVLWEGHVLQSETNVTQGSGGDPMRSMSIREIRAALPTLAEIVEREGELIITRRGNPIARIVPIERTRTMPSRADFRSTMKPLGTPSEVLLREERDRS